MTEAEARIIKKYPNRRLYDTAISSYITLEDVRRLVMDQIAIKVIDAKSQADITHNTLLQIIIEQEENGPSLFSTDSLQQMIRIYGGTMQKMLSKMFEQGMNFFTAQQLYFKSQMDGAPNTDEQNKNESLNFMTDFAQKNVAKWQQLQHQWLEAMASSVNKETDKTETAESFSINNAK